MVLVPESRVWESTTPRASGARPNGTQRRTSTRGTEGRRMAITVSPLASVRSASVGTLSLRVGPSAGRVRVTSLLRG